MIDENTKEVNNRAPNIISTADLSRMIKRFSYMFAAGDLGNYETSEALAHLADFLRDLGSMPVDQLYRAGPNFDPQRRKIRPSEFDNITLEQIEQTLADHSVSKAMLIKLGRARFGMPESRLKRLPLAAVIDAVRAAASHEQSLDAIDRNAEASGRARQS